MDGTLTPGDEEVVKGVMADLVAQKYDARLRDDAVALARLFFAKNYQVCFRRWSRRTT